MLVYLSQFGCLCPPSRLGCRGRLNLTFHLSNTSCKFEDVISWPFKQQKHLEGGSFEKDTLVLVCNIGDCEAFCVALGVQSQTASRAREDADCQGDCSDDFLLGLLRRCQLGSALLILSCDCSLSCDSCCILCQCAIKDCHKFIKVRVGKNIIPFLHIEAR